MELESIRAVDAALRDGTIGINAMISGLTKDLITDVLPGMVTVYNYVDHPWLTRKKLNHDEVEAGHIAFPAIGVYLASPPTLTPEIGTTYRDGEVPIVIGYFTIRPEEGQRMRDALYVNRAVNRFLTQFNSNASATTFRLRNNISLYSMKALQQTTPFVPWETAVLSAATLCTFEVRELQP